MSERRINWAPFIPILLIALGSLILLGVLGYGYYQFILSNPNSAPLPETIIEFPLQRHAFGAQAVEEINNLHNLKFPLSSGAVAVYGSQGKVTLWVSGRHGGWAISNPARVTAASTAPTSLAQQSASPSTPSQTTRV